MLVSGEEANNLPGLHCGYGGWVGVDTYQWQHLWRGHVQVISVALFCFALLMLFLLCQQWVRPWSDLPYCHPWDFEGDEARRLPALDNARGLPAEKSEVPCSSEMKEMAMGRRIPSCALISGLLWWTPRSRTWRALGRRRWLLGLLSLKTLSLIILEGEAGWYDADVSTLTPPYSDSTWCARPHRSILLCLNITMSEPAFTLY